jgi:hypothetical protein
MDDQRAPASTALILELDPGSEPIAGRLNADGCEPAEFTGYMQLITLLEKQRRVGAERAA